MIFLFYVLAGYEVYMVLRNFKIVARSNEESITVLNSLKSRDGFKKGSNGAFLTLLCIMTFMDIIFCIGMAIKVNYMPFDIISVAAIILALSELELFHRIAENKSIENVKMRYRVIAWDVYILTCLVLLFI